MSSEQMANIIILYLESNNYRVLSIYVGLFFKKVHTTACYKGNGILFISPIYFSPLLRATCLLAFLFKTVCVSVSYL